MLLKTASLEIYKANLSYHGTYNIENIDGLLMLIDFEKAFDSISWKFMYNTVEFLGLVKLLYIGFSC